jgi:hypothetical protein
MPKFMPGPGWFIIAPWALIGFIVFGCSALS